MIAVRYLRRDYAAHKETGGKIVVRAGYNKKVFTDEELARRWLCDNGLRKGKAIQLLAAELRGEGPLANAEHPSRCIARNQQTQ